MNNKGRQSLVLRWLLICAIAVLLVGAVPLVSQPLFAQGDGDTGGGDTDGGGGGGGGGGDGEDARGGILVNPNGVVSRFAVRDVGRLSEAQLNARRASYTLSADISAQTPMRCISLNSMEKTIIADEGNINEEMMYLAGIQKITHVFYFPESKDIVIAGPAEGWFPGPEGTMIGNESRQPVCELQHLVTALRLYGPGKESGTIVGCSIDPTEQGIVRLNRFVEQFRGTPRAFVQGVRNSIGMQTIEVDGVPAATHAAQMMVAADYRMKLIGLGVDRLAVRGLQTFIDNTEVGAANALFRWYFVPDYESVILTEDKTGMELVGSGVKLIGENEVVSLTTGERSPASGLDPGSRAFTTSFTQMYPQIAERALVFAQLRNWIDMLICAAHIQREGFYEKSGWTMEFFGDEEKYPLETYNAPTTVNPVVGQRTIGNRRQSQTLAPVGGGIVIDAERAFDAENIKSDVDGKIAERQKQISQNLPEGVWWWDVR